MVDPFSSILFQPVLHNRCNKDRCIYYLACGMVHIKYPLLLIERVAFAEATTVVLHQMSDAPYNRKQNVLSASVIPPGLSVDCNLAGMVILTRFPFIK